MIQPPLAGGLMTVRARGEPQTAISSMQLIARVEDKIDCEGSNKFRKKHAGAQTANNRLVQCSSLLSKCETTHEKFHRSFLY